MGINTANAAWGYRHSCNIDCSSFPVETGKIVELALLILLGLVVLYLLVRRLSGASFPGIAKYPFRS